MRACSCVRMQIKVAVNCCVRDSEYNMHVRMKFSDQNPGTAREVRSDVYAGAASIHRFRSLNLYVYVHAC